MIHFSNKKRPFLLITSNTFLISGKLLISIFEYAGIHFHHTQATPKGSCLIHPKPTDRKEKSCCSSLNNAKKRLTHTKRSNFYCNCFMDPSVPLHNLWICWQINAVQFEQSCRRSQFSNNQCGMRNGGMVNPVVRGACSKCYYTWNGHRNHAPERNDTQRSSGTPLVTIFGNHLIMLQDPSPATLS